MYAIVEIAGKQYKITEGVSINVDKLEPTEKEIGRASCRERVSSPV